MKRFIFCLSVVFVIINISLPCYAKNGDIFDNELFTFSIDDEELNRVSVYSYSGNEENVNIPAIVSYNDKTYSVTAIGWSAFKDCKSLRTVTIPESVTSIGGSAFSGCLTLNSVTIPGTVKTLGWSVFAGCCSLSSINLPNLITSIPGSAFSGCSSLTSIIIPDSVTSIGGSAFSGCTSLTSINIPKGVTSIQSFAFKDCKALESVYSYSTNPPVCDNYTFMSIPENTVLHIPFNSKDAYSIARGWSVFNYISDDIDPSASAPTLNADLDNSPHILKLFKNGQIYIIKGDKVFSPSGILLGNSEEY